MIRFKKDAIIIELPTAAPFEELVYLQRALTDALRYRDTTLKGERVSEMVTIIAQLIEAVSLDEDQMICIGRLANKMPESAREALLA